MKLTIAIIALIFFVGISCYLLGERQNLKTIIKQGEQIDHYKKTWMPIKGKGG